MQLKKCTAILLAAALTAASFTGCGINKSAVIATMGDEKVEMGLANFMCRYEQASMNDLYAAYFGEGFWEEDLYGSGSTMEEDTKNDVMDNIHELYTLAEADHMEEYEVSLTDEDEEAITQAASDFMAANTKAALNEMGATQEIVEEMLRLFTIKSKMHAAIIATADTEVSDEEANMRAYTMVSVGRNSYYDSSSYSYVDYTDEEKEQVEESMELLSQYVKSGATLENAASLLGMEATTGTYDADDDSLDTEVKDALDGLEEGETSDLIITDDNLYMVRIDSDCDEEATESNRESILETRQSDKYDEVLAAWQEDDGWTVKSKQLEKISFFNTLTQTTESTETEGTEEATE